MGVTIRSPHHSIDMSYAGFGRLRRDIAYLYNDELGNHYATLSQCHDTADYEAHDCEANRLFTVYGPSVQWLFEFLYEPDVDGKLTYGKCKKLLKLIENCDDNIAYGYVGRNDCATMRDFKKLLVDCADTKRQLTWY